jgi:hypothetical protein
MHEVTALLKEGSLASVVHSNIGWMEEEQCTSFFVAIIQTSLSCDEPPNVPFLHPITYKLLVESKTAECP